MPRARNLPPGYEQKFFSEEERRGRWRLVASPNGEDGSVTIQQDARLYAATIAPASTIEHRLDDGRHAWLQVARGGVTLNDQALQQGDGAAISHEGVLRITATDEAELLLFDLA